MTSVAHARAGTPGARGLAECLGGALVFFRRTTTLGALVTIAVMANVVMLNFSYGVFVKLFAAHILLMAVYLALPDLGRLWRVLVLHVAAEPALFRPHFQATLSRRAGAAVKALFGTYLIASALSVQVDAWRSFGDGRPRPSLYGIWEVESFAIGGVETPPLATDGTRWRRLVLDVAGTNVSSSSATIWKMTDAREHFRADEDAAKGTLTLFGRKDVHTVFARARPEPDEMVLTGPTDAGAVRIALHRVDEKTLRLVGESFHWVNDHPFGTN